MQLSAFERPENSAQSSRIAGKIERVGRALALLGAVLPLLLIGELKFTSVEIEALKPVIGESPGRARLRAREAANGL